MMRFNLEIVSKSNVIKHQNNKNSPLNKWYDLYKENWIMEFDKVLFEKLKEDICKKYSFRRGKRKKHFRLYVKQYVNENGINYEEDEYSNWFSKNIVLGDLNNAKYIVCAHYDTAYQFVYEKITNFLFKDCNKPFFISFKQICNIFIISAVFSLAFMTQNLLMYLLLFLICFPCVNKKNFNDNSSGVILSLLFLKRKDVCVVLFDNEEIGLFGSRRFEKSARNLINDKIIINLDTIGNCTHFIYWFYNAKSQVVKLVNNSNFNFILNSFHGDHYSFTKHKCISIGGVHVIQKNKYFSKFIHTSKDCEINYFNIYNLYCLLMSFFNQSNNE